MRPDKESAHQQSVRNEVQSVTYFQFVLYFDIEYSSGRISLQYGHITAPSGLAPGQPGYIWEAPILVILVAVDVGRFASKCLMSSLEPTSVAEATIVAASSMASSLVADRQVVVTVMLGAGCEISGRLTRLVVSNAVGFSAYDTDS